MDADAIRYILLGLFLTLIAILACIQWRKARQQERDTLKLAFKARIGHQEDQFRLPSVAEVDTAIREDGEKARNRVLAQ